MTLPCRNMNQAQIEEFVDAPRFGAFGTNRRDGPPQLTPVWYLYENSKIYISMFVASAKYRNLSRDPRATLCIAGDFPDSRAVIFSGAVQLHTAGTEGWIEDVTWRLTRRYYESDEEAKSYLESQAGSGQSALAVLIPDKVIAEDYN